MGGRVNKRTMAFATVLCLGAATAAFVAPGGHAATHRSTFDTYEVDTRSGGTDSYTNVADKILADYARTGVATATRDSFAHYLARANGDTDATSIVAALPEGYLISFDPNRVPASVTTTTVAGSTTTAAPTTTAAATTTTAAATTTTAAATTTTAAATTTTAGGTGGAACGLTSAAFCDTFDVAHNGGTQTGDLDPVVWGVSRAGDFDGSSHVNGWTASHNACSSPAADVAPADVRVCNGQMVESVNDGGQNENLDTYPKQPFNFAGRTGKVVFDVSADSDGTHGAWPEFLITDKPVPAAKRSISFQEPAHAQNSIGFSLDGCDAGPGGNTGVGVMFGSVNGTYFEQQNSRPNCVTKGSASAMNHFEVRVSQTHIEVWGTNAGSSTLKQLAVEDVALNFTQGLVWLNDSHYNARKAVEPCECGTQFDHSFFWDNLGFDGPKTYRDLGYDVPLNTAAGVPSFAGDAETNLGYFVGTGPVNLPTVNVTNKGAATAALVVFNGYAYSAATVNVSVNGHTAVAVTLPIGFGITSNFVTVPVSDIVTGANTITMSSNDGHTAVANVSIIMVHATEVP